MIKEYLNVIDNETKEFLKKNVLHNLNFPYFLNHTEMDEGDSKVTNKNNDFCLLKSRKKLYFLTSNPVYDFFCSTFFYFTYFVF